MKTSSSVSKSNTCKTPIESEKQVFVNAMFWNHEEIIEKLRKTK